MTLGGGLLCSSRRSVSPLPHNVTGDNIEHMHTIYGLVCILCHLILTVLMLMLVLVMVTICLDSTPQYHTWQRWAYSHHIWYGDQTKCVWIQNKRTTKLSNISVLNYPDSYYIDRLFLSVLTLLLVLVTGAINVMINDNYIINQGAVLVIMGAILSTLTSVSLHYDHSPLALPMEVGHYPHLTCC